jgi:hypothetical protein
MGRFIKKGGNLEMTDGMVEITEKEALITIKNSFVGKLAAAKVNIGFQNVIVKQDPDPKKKEEAEKAMRGFQTQKDDYEILVDVCNTLISIAEPKAKEERKTN